MTSTQDLLGVIAALRQRLDQAQSLASDAGAAAASVLERAAPQRIARLRQQIGAGLELRQELRATLRAAGYRDEGPGSTSVPAHLTSRAAHLVQQTHDLLQHLKPLAAEPLLHAEDHPAAAHYQDTILLSELVLRILQHLPEQPSLQLRQCGGVDVLLGLIRQRFGILDSIVQRHNRNSGQRLALERILTQLVDGTFTDIAPLFALAEEITQDAGKGQPLGFPFVHTTSVVTTDSENTNALCQVGGHCLATARIMARVAPSDPHWRNHLLQAVAAALVHDVGMLTLPADPLSQAGPLDDEQRAVMERHCLAGANLLAPVRRLYGWLREVALQHHERVDGSGYPAGLIEAQITPLARLVAVCDVYAALTVPRPHRNAVDPAAAMKQTILLARQGRLDSYYAQLLRELGCYPAGSAVELADGATGIVIASANDNQEDDSPARPVVAVLTNQDGRPRSHPHWVDLSRCAQGHVQRCLTTEERCQRLGQDYPHYLIP
jgi:HD-GYP domain-containing protein (c-di-GMP phosphodiesterase class II)